MTDQTGTELVAAEPTPRAHAHMMTISERSGLVAYASMADIIEAAKLMAQSGFAVRQQFRGNPGACMAVIQQSLRWGMDQYAVANRSYHVNNQLSYESSVIQSVILVNAPIKGRLKHEFIGEGADRRCRVWAKLRDEPDEIVEYTSPRFADITPKNSPLWKSDPDQQHYYSAARAFCRRHFPEVLLGVLDREEADVIDGEYHELPARETTGDKLNRIAAPKTERKPRGSAAAAAPAAEVQPPHDQDTGEIKTEPTGPAQAEIDKAVTEYGQAKDFEAIQKIRAGVAAIGPELTKHPEVAKAYDAANDRVKAANKKAEADPVVVTSGKPNRDPEADRRASEQEMAAAAGALDPESDPFKDDEDEAKAEPSHPVRVALDAFLKSAPAAQTEEQMETLRKALLKEIKNSKLAETDPLYKEAGTTYTKEFAAFQARLNPPKTAPTEGLTPEEENELEGLLTNQLDHRPTGIDLDDLHQVRAYVQGLKAAAKGRAVSAVPAIFGEVEASAWTAGHKYRTANPVADAE